MADPIITNIDNGSVIIEGQADRFDTYTSPAGITLAGTILARLTATLKLVPFVKGGAAGAEIPVAVLTYETNSPGGGDIEITSFVSGKVQVERLVIRADGDASNIDAAVIDQLQDYGIVALSVSQLSILDNQ